MSDIENRILELRRVLDYHRKKYYIDDSPEISDYLYDKMFYELVALENFFRSDWSKILTSVDGEYLMERLRKEVIEEQKKS